METFSKFNLLHFLRSAFFWGSKPGCNENCYVCFSIVCFLQFDHPAGHPSGWSQTSPTCLAWSSSCWALHMAAEYSGGSKTKGPRDSSDFSTLRCLTLKALVGFKWCSPLIRVLGIGNVLAHSQVGSQSISPLFWALRSGAHSVAKSLTEMSAFLNFFGVLRKYGTQLNTFQLAEL